MIGQAWRTALDPKGEWMPSVLAAADKRLTEVRRGVPDAGGLVIATDQEVARAYAALLRQVSGEAPVVVLSDDDSASDRIEEFAAGDQRWMVAVRMVSEGVDVPRLSVGVYATSTSTPLFFAQAVGRFVRARKRGETASVFVPSVPHLLLHAAEMERERDHVLRAPSATDDDGLDDALLEAAERLESEEDRPEGGGFAALASEADFDRVVFDGGEFGMTAQTGSAEEQDYLGLPGLLEPAQVKDLLRRHQDAQSRSTGRTRAAADPTTGERLKELRRELNGLVAAWPHRTSSPHGVIHADLRSACGGPPTAVASAEDLERRIATIRSW